MDFRQQRECNLSGFDSECPAEIKQRSREVTPLQLSNRSQPCKFSV